MPDILNGEPVLNIEDIYNPAIDKVKWHKEHGPDSWIPVLDQVVAALKESGVTRIGTTSDCFGAPPAFYLALKNESHVTVLSHPSRLTVPDDVLCAIHETWFHSNAYGNYCHRNTWLNLRRRC